MIQPIRKILVPLDGSESAQKAAQFAGTLASALKASLTFFHVQDEAVLAVLGMIRVDTLSAGPNKVMGRSPEELEELVHKYVTDPYFEAAKAVLADDSIEITIERCRGQPAREICRYAEREGVDLIVMGSRGRSQFGELLLGSVSSQVMHHAPCAVTIVR